MWSSPSSTNQNPPSNGCWGNTRLYVKLTQKEWHQDKRTEESESSTMLWWKCQGLCRKWHHSSGMSITSTCDIINIQDRLQNGTCDCAIQGTENVYMKRIATFVEIIIYILFICNVIIIVRGVSLPSRDELKAECFSSFWMEWGPPPNTRIRFLSSDLKN